MVPETTHWLGRWYADPLNRPAAEALLAQARTRRQQYEARGRNCRMCWLLELIGHHGLGEDIGERYLLARQALGRSGHGRALVELIHGQLLASRRLPGAHEHLAQGFRLAQPMLAASDYFELFKRHQLLQRLPLNMQPSPPATLDELLTTARVIARLERDTRPQTLPPHDPTDLYG